MPIHASMPFELAKEIVEDMRIGESMSVHLFFRKMSRISDKRMSRSIMEHMQKNGLIAMSRDRKSFLKQAPKHPKGADQHDFW